jgi:hypothetical protein
MSAAKSEVGVTFVSGFRFAHPNYQAVNLLVMPVLVAGIHVFL